MLSVTALWHTTGAINSNSPSVSSPGEGKHPPLSACHYACLDLMASRPLARRGWALREKTQPSVTSMFPLPWLCTASTGLCSTPCSGRDPCLIKLLVVAAVLHHLLTAVAMHWSLQQELRQQSVWQESHFSTSENVGRAQTACKQPNMKREAQDMKTQGTV